jgi:cystathionine beta-lyase/cystathionine gamma-synthase
VLAFDLAGGRETVRTLLDRIQLARRATSLGGPETLVCHPMTTTHASLTADEQADTGVTEGLVRVSLGLEDPGDIIADFSRALA